MDCIFKQQPHFCFTSNSSVSREVSFQEPQLNSMKASYYHHPVGFFLLQLTEQTISMQSDTMTKSPIQEKQRDIFGSFLKIPPVPPSGRRQFVHNTVSLPVTFGRPLKQTHAANTEQSFYLYIRRYVQTIFQFRHISTFISFIFFLLCPSENQPDIVPI